MLILDKLRALDRILYLSDRTANAVPTDFLRAAPLRWIATPTGGRALAAEVVLRPAATETPSDTTWLEARVSIDGLMLVGDHVDERATNPS